jgi:enamine deaminase RidA (YjgF/YER057c/UK114 family)
MTSHPREQLYLERNAADRKGKHTMDEQRAASGSVEYLQPAGLHNNPAYTNVVVVSGAVKTVYVGAQGALDASGTLVGEGDIGAQTEQALKNMQTALAAAGAGLEHVIKWNIYLTQGQPIGPGVAAFQRLWGNRPNPPANTVVFVSELGPAGFLVLIEAIAVVPE